MRNFISSILVLMLLFVHSGVEAQTPSQAAVVAQVRAILNSKGLDENEVKARLMSKGIDIEKMSQEDLIRNKAVIEQTVNEMEAEKKAAKPSAVVSAAPSMVKSPIDTVIIDNTPVQISKQEAAAELLAEEVQDVVPLSSIYGHKIFKEKSLEVYKISKDASPPDNYVLAPGDKINILIFGRSQADLSFEVNSAGFIQPAQMPKIFLSGLTLKQAKEMLINKFSTYYVFDAGQFALTLNTSRTLTVNVFGEVERPGSFTTSALNTALGALTSAGGPTEIGSVRNIQIIRGSTRKTLDVYAFMRDPALQFDFYLQNNDILYIPASDKLVTLEGAVKRPMIYELKPAEGLKELLEYAGGLKVDAYTDFLQVQRIENNKVVLQDHNLSDILAKKTTLELRNGDVIRIRSINSPLKSIVKASGAVLYPGEFDIKTTPTLKTLLSKASLKPEAKLEQGFLLRKKLDQTTEVIAVDLKALMENKRPDFNLIQEDELLVYEQARYTDQFAISIVGEVRNPMQRSFAYDKGLTVKEALELAGGLTPRASAQGYIYRTDPFNAKKTAYIPVEINLNNTETLKPGDQLVVLNKDSYVIESSISITGDVNKPATLRYDSSLSIPDLINISGGLTLSSNPQFVEVFRLGFEVGKPPVRSLIKVDLDKNLQPTQGNFALQPFDVVVVRKTPEFHLQETITISGEVNKPGPFVLRSKKYHFSDLIADAGGFNNVADAYGTSLVRYFENKGLIAFNAEDALRYKGNLKKDPVLMDKDYVIVPRADNIVTINPLGTNYQLSGGQQAINITYQGLASARRYVKKYGGGFADRNERRYFRVMHQNGLQESTREWLFFRAHPKVKPGDKVSIYHLTKEQKAKREVKPLDWDKFITRILAAFTTMALINAYVK